MPSQRPEFIHSPGERPFDPECTRHPAGGDEVIEPSEPCLFEVQHGATVIRIADDWDGHLLIEKLYVGLRQARTARDKTTRLTQAGPVRDRED